MNFKTLVFWRCQNSQVVVEVESVRRVCSVVVVVESSGVEWKRTGGAEVASLSSGSLTK